MIRGLRDEERKRDASVGQRAKRPRQQGQGFGRERKEERACKRGKGYRIRTEREKQ